MKLLSSAHFHQFLLKCNIDTMPQTTRGASPFSSSNSTYLKLFHRALSVPRPVCRASYYRTVSRGSTLRSSWAASCTPGTTPAMKAPFLETIFRLEEFIMPPLGILVCCVTGQHTPNAKLTQPRLYLNRVRLRLFSVLFRILRPCASQTNATGQDEKCWRKCVQRAAPRLFFCFFCCLDGTALVFI